MPFEKLKGAEPPFDSPHLNRWLTDKRLWHAAQAEMRERAVLAGCYGCRQGWKVCACEMANADHHHRDIANGGFHFCTSADIRTLEIT